MNMTQIIRLSSVVGDDIRTRSRIHEIEQHIGSSGEYILDFSQVRFISRSFADELISFIDSSACKITCSHVPAEISQLLRIVRENRNQPRNTYQKRGVLQLTDMEQMAAFFETI